MMLDVVRLDVPMHEALTVGVRQRVRCLARDLESVGEGQLLLPLHAVAQRLALDKRHHVVQQPLTRGPGVVERQDVRVAELGRDLDFSEKPLGTERDREILVKHLDRHHTIVLEVAGEVNGRHTSGTKLLLDIVAIGEACSEALDYVRHCVGSR
jgi:hypothetical protein